MDKSYRIELKYQHHGGVLIFNYLWNGPQTPLRRLYGPLAADCAHRRPLGQIGSWWAWSGLLHSSGCRRCNSDDRWWENSKVSRSCTSLRLWVCSSSDLQISLLTVEEQANPLPSIETRGSSATGPRFANCSSTEPLLSKLYNWVMYRPSVIF